MLIHGIFIYQICVCKHVYQNFSNGGTVGPQSNLKSPQVKIVQMRNLANPIHRRNHRKETKLEET